MIYGLFEVLFDYAIEKGRRAQIQIGERRQRITCAALFIPSKQDFEDGQVFYSCCSLHV
jgi:hypothetical protein